MKTPSSTNPRIWYWCTCSRFPGLGSSALDSISVYPPDLSSASKSSCCIECVLQKNFESSQPKRYCRQLCVVRCPCACQSTAIADDLIPAASPHRMQPFQLMKAECRWLAHSLRAARLPPQSG